MMTENRDRSNLELLLEANEEMRRLELISGDENDPRALLHPAVDSKGALGLFGLLLGTLIPASIYGRLVLSDLGVMMIPAIPLLFVISVIVCALVGRCFARRLSLNLERNRYAGLKQILASSVLIGILWGLITGGLGGLVVYGFGGVVGAIAASVTAVITFPIFALLYYALSRGGMIESRQLWPIALGIPAILAALILGL
jgi:hypothetical protein